MANIFQTSTGYRDPQKAMTLKALEERAKAAQEAVSQSMQPQVIAAPEQGWAGLLGTLGAKMEQSRADSAAMQGRADLSQIMSGVNMDTGPDMGQIAKIAAYDPELAKSMYDQAMETRQANLNREDTQAFQAGESSLERQQRQALQDQADALTRSESSLQRTSTEGIAGANRTSQENVAGADRTSRENVAGADRTSRENVAGADRTSRETVAQANNDAAVTQLADQIAAIDKDPRLSPEEKEAAKGKLTAAGGMILSTTTDAEGNTTTTYDTTGKGSDPRAKNNANALETYRARAQAGNDLLPTIDMMRKAGGNLGHSGFGGSLYGFADDALESLTTSVLGKDISFPGSSGSRALMARGALDFLQDAIAKTKGSISEAENTLFLKAAPTLDQTPEGREFMLAYAEKLAQRSVEKADAAESYAAEHDGNLDGFEVEWNAYIRENPVVVMGDDGNLVFTE